MKISYAITVCNEHAQLKFLLDKLTKFISKKRPSDEIVIQYDQSKITPEVYKVISDYVGLFNPKVTGYMLNKNFADFKNHLNSKCSGDWIFQLDADEYPDDHLLYSLHEIIADLPEDLEALWVPRINMVAGITDEHIRKWGWHINEKRWINFPDFQLRIYKNSDRIYWTKPVHEQLTGYKSYAKLPMEQYYCLWHPKTIKRQEKQNEFYSNL